ncbi:MAG: molybdopterin molybdotransferase [Acidobacteriota bacterium]|jgi:molybdenum cofactor synthesis domain-containing protein|nr:molybdopterin molybdotransferase [Acidobacteriota bacterium]
MKDKLFSIRHSRLSTELSARHSAIFMIPVAEAISIVIEKTEPLTHERVSLADSVGRVLAEDVFADSDLPPFDRAQMDGYAVRSEDLREMPARLRVVGEAAAGRGWRGELGKGEAVRIMTGAPMPLGADSVQQVELTRETDEGDFVLIERETAPGQFYVTRASEIRAGERVVEAGEEITAARVAALASFGYAEVSVGRRPRVLVLATGTELVPVGEKPGEDQIRDSNSYSLAAYARLAGAEVERLPFAGDDAELLQREIAAAAERADLLVLSGGVSMGRYDFTKAALRSLSAEIFFERVALRPGKPTVFARLPSERRTLVFGLPGNPVSVSVTFNLFARTALGVMQGLTRPALAEDSAVLSRTARGALERTSYLPASLSTDGAGHLLAEPLKWGGSSDFVAFTRATALVIVPAGVGTVEAGSIVRVVRLPG